MMRAICLFVLMLNCSNVSAQPFYAEIANGCNLACGNGSDYFRIKIKGGKIHSVHVINVNAQTWRIYDDINYFSPSWYASASGDNPGLFPGGSWGGSGGFAWNAGVAGDHKPGGYYFSVPFGEGINVRLTSKNILVDLEDGTYHTTSPTPEPSTWLMMVLGFGLIGWSLRRTQTAFC
jgi:hypothetical protein